MTIDYPDYGTSADRALKVYTQRVPLARNSASIGSGVGNTLAAGGNVQLVTAVAIDQPAYQVELGALLPLGAGGTPFARLTMVWTDAATGDGVSQRSIVLASGDGKINVGRLIGVSRSDLLTVVLSNLHATAILTYNYDVSPISHVPTDDDYGNDVPSMVSGYTRPGLQPDLGVLAVTTPTVVPGVPQERLTGASNALCSICVDNTGQVNPCDVQISDPAPTVPLYGSTAGALFWRSGSVAAGAVLNGQYQMPSGEVLITITNLGGAGNIAPKVTITEQRS
jgi:hypothetical protein